MFTSVMTGLVLRTNSAVQRDTEKVRSGVLASFRSPTYRAREHFKDTRIARDGEFRKP
jgi:hypothetical protein